jgi:hypothetical protein
VGVEVSIQVALLSEPLAAVRASVWALASVDPLVSYQIALLRKSLFTDFTRIGLPTNACFSFNVK